MSKFHKFRKLNPSSKIPTTAPKTTTSKNELHLDLAQMGWKTFFQQQLSLEEWNELTPCRVMAHHRSLLECLGEYGPIKIPLQPLLTKVTVGDWLLVDKQQRAIRVLERFSCFSRKAAGTKVDEQLIAANIDSVFIVTSLNQDFNLSRIERYLALAHEARVQPILILSKADLCDLTEEFTHQAQALDPLLDVIALNGLDANVKSLLQAYCSKGQSVAFIGSSGVGKSTLVNSLVGSSEQSTGGIREDDSKGHHTTTGRSLHQIPEGGWLLDTPGMRELQLADCAVGLSETFADIEALADECRFNNCSHQSEPGCAIQKALIASLLDKRRLNNYLKLKREEANNSATLAEKREKEKSLSKLYRTTQEASRKNKKG